MDQKLWGNENFKKSLVGQASAGANQQKLTTLAQKGGQQE
jgi:hypothetical protein